MNNYPFSQQNNPMASGFGFVQVPPEQVKDPMTIQKFMRKFNDENREQFNEQWFERDDDAIIEGVEKVIESCVRDKYFLLKVLSFRVVKDYEEIYRILRENANKKTKNGKKIDNPYDYIDLRDSDIMLLIVRYYIKINIPEDQIRIDPKTKEKEQTEGELEVLICLPRYVNKYYFRIQGNYYTPVFQIVDGSTYNNSTSNAKTQAITLKTHFMPIKVYREFYELEDVEWKDKVKCTLYTSYIFKKKTDCMKYILGRYGLYGAMEMLELPDIHIGKEPIWPNQYYNFRCRDKSTIVSAPKMIFDNDPMTQSFVFTLCKNIHKYENFEDIFNPRYWNKSLGGDFMAATLEKGIPVLDSLESVYDLATKESIKLPEEDKADVYCILRWMMREFRALKNKDNLDISTKKARLADGYIPALYAAKISRAIYRISDKGKSVRYKDVVKAIDTPPNYILRTINTSNLVFYVDLVNDNDAELALNYTYKGISGLGDQGSGKSVPNIYRYIHASHIGKVDLDSSSASDPGLSGTICPMAKRYGDSFSNYDEPNSWKEAFTKLWDQYKELNGMIETIEFQKKLGLSYDYVKEDMVRETIGMYKKLICAVSDIDGKIDYSISESIMTSLKDATLKEDNLPIGSITSDYEDVPEDEEEETNGSIY